jgi:UDP-3-O-[3-hydroxymyristoyl] glucosamine N-acyltransferase
MRVTVADIVARLGGQCLGDASLVIERIATLDAAQPSHMAFLSNPRYRSQLESTRAGCVIVAPAQAEEAAARGTAIVTPDPYLYYARLSQWWAEADTAPPGVHPSAVVEPGAVIAADATIGALSYIGAGAVIGAGTRIAARVTIGERCMLGARGIVHSGVVIGADGFGFAPHQVDGQGRWEKIAQLGAVCIGDDVEIGANTCIDRGALDDTVIEDGVKLDNQIQIGHNVRVGAHSAMAGCVGVAGSTKIGRHCTFGGGAMVLGHLELADHVHISAATVVSHSIRKPGQYSGFFPIDDNASWEKNAVTLRQLYALRERLRALERQKPS